MKKTLSFTLILLLAQMFFVHPAFAETKADKLAGKVRSGIMQLGTGSNAKIKVKLKDGSKIEGYVTESNENQFVVMNLKTGEPVSVSYSSVKQVKGNNLSSGVKILIGVAALIAVVAIIIAVVNSQGGG